MSTVFREIDVGSPLYEAEVALRVEVLRAPTGRTHGPADRPRDVEGHHFVAVDEGRVVGCVGFYPLASGAVLLRHLAVAPAMRRRGLARGLLDFAEQWLRRNGFARVEAEARIDALSFYQACGFAAAPDEYEKHGVRHRRITKALAFDRLAEEV